MPERTAKVLKMVRETLDLDVIDFAKILDLSLTRYKEYESARRCMNVRTLRHIAKKLGVTASFLLAEKEYMLLEQEEILTKIKEKVLKDSQ